MKRPDPSERPAEGDADLPTSELGETREVPAGSPRSSRNEASTTGDVPDGQPERVLGDYRLLRELGRGGMGVVYEAEQISLGRRVALKILPKSVLTGSVEIERFQREAAAIAKLQHPGIVPVHSVGEDQGIHYFSMELVEGTSLADAIQEFKDQTRGQAASLRASKGERSYAAEAAEIVAQVADALQYAHDRGVIHRDVKPQNIMLEEDGRPRLLDFGLAKEVGVKSLSLTGSLTGTPHYMSPEQLLAKRVKVDHRTDVYSLGVVLYELLTFQVPFQGQTFQEVLTRISFKEPKAPRSLNAGVPTDLETICLEAIDKDPDARYATARDFADDLRRFLRLEPILAKPPGLVRRAVKLCRREPAKAVAVLLFLILIVGGPVAFGFVQQAAAQRESGLRAETEQERRKTTEALELAEQNAQEARQNLGELLQLSSIEILTDLRRRADEELWPPAQHNILEMKAWIADAEREVLPLLEPLEAQRVRLEGEAAPYTEDQARRDRESHPEAAALSEARSQVKDLEEQIAEANEKPAGAAALLAGAANAERQEEIERLEQALEAKRNEAARLEQLVSERRTWEFEGDDKMDASQKRWRYHLLESLLTDLRSFVDGPGQPDSAAVGYPGECFGSSLPEVRKRLELANRLRQETVDSDAAKIAWSEAIVRIENHPEYGGLELSVQEGLFPIGPDPISELHLEEFAVLATGERPSRGDATGQILVSDEMALILVLIPGGEFDMGAIPPDADHLAGAPNVDPQARSDEAPIRRVVLDPFFLSKYEMTQGQWERARALRPSSFNADRFARAAWRRHPVEQVSWLDGDEVLSRLGLELPTEAQWEYAERARTTTVWWPGNEESDLEGAANLVDRSNQRSGGTSPTVAWDDGFPVHAPVGSFRANAFGLHDVIGNVWEWCQDGFADYEVEPRAGDGLRVIASPHNRVNRGSSYGAAAGNARSANRNRGAPALGTSTLGLRPARAIER